MVLPCHIFAQLFTSSNRSHSMHPPSPTTRKMGNIPAKTLGFSGHKNDHIMAQRQLFHSMLMLFSIFIFIDGFRLFIDVLPKLIPSIANSLHDFYKEMKWPLPSFSSVSYILSLLLPFLATIALAGLVFYKANNLAVWFFPEASNSPLVVYLQPEEWLRWGITLIGIFLLGWLTIPSLLSTIFHPLVMNFFPDLDTEKPYMAMVHGMYWSSFVGNVARFLILGSFGLVCLLYAPRLATWIIRIQKHPLSSPNQ